MRDRHVSSIYMNACLSFLPNTYVSLGMHTAYIRHDVSGQMSTREWASEIVTIVFELKTSIYLFIHLLCGYMREARARAGPMLVTDAMYTQYSYEHTYMLCMNFNHERSFLPLWLFICMRVFEFFEESFSHDDKPKIWIKWKKRRQNESESTIRKSAHYSSWWEQFAHIVDMILGPLALWAFGSILCPRNKTDREARDMERTSNDDEMMRTHSYSHTSDTRTFAWRPWHCICNWNLIRSRRRQQHQHHCFIYRKLSKSRESFTKLALADKFLIFFFHWFFRFSGQIFAFFLSFASSKWLCYFSSRDASVCSLSVVIVGRMNSDWILSSHDKFVEEKVATNVFRNENLPKSSYRDKYAIMKKQFKRKWTNEQMKNKKAIKIDIRHILS